MDKAIRVQNQDKTDCILDKANTHGKYMKPTSLLPAIGKLFSLTMLCQPVKEKENS